MKHSTMSSSRYLVPPFVLWLLSGCQVGPAYTVPATPAPAAFKEQGPQDAPDGTAWQAAHPQDGRPRGNWWEVFQEPELDALEGRLDLSNQNIAKAFDNFLAARAVVRQAQAGYYPTVSVGASAARVRTSQNLATASGGNPESSLFSLPFDVSWEPDLWGKVRNTVRQAAYSAQVSAADLENQRLAEQANLAVFYFQLRGQDALCDLYRQMARTDQDSLDLTRDRYRFGLDHEEAVVQAELALQATEAAATQVRIDRAQYEHGIALLVGEPASSFSLPMRPLSTTVPRIPAGLPSELLQRRPDIAAAERTLAAANALIGVQQAAFYPTLSLGGSFGFQASTLSRWLASPSRYGSVGPAASATLIDGGLRKATLDQCRAQHEAAVANYKQVVLTAFQQTEDLLATTRLLAPEVGQQQGVVASAKRFLDLAEARYRTGLDPRLNVFTAQASLFASQQNLVTLQVKQLGACVQLIEALGGGWEVSRLPTEQEVEGPDPADRK